MLKEIKEQVRKVVAYSQDIPDPQVDELIDNWLEAKRDIIEAFGGKLIVEMPFPVTFHIKEDSKERRIEDFVRYIDSEYDNGELCDFIMKNRESFYDNTVSHGVVTNNDKMITQGSKLVKSFKYFVPGKSALEDIQIRASRIIQEDNVTGTLCFSVHPLDYLSSSENTYNWRSCHALDGEYRAGNLSYMQDKSTIVCYLKGDNKVKLPMFPDDVPWNNKKWRMLVYLSDNWDLIFAGRQYPFNSEDALERVRFYLLSTLDKEIHTYCDWTDPLIAEVPDSYGHEYDLNSNYVMMRGELYKIEDVVVDSPGSLHFNDVLHSSYYKPLYTLVNNKPWFKHIPSTVHVGHKTTCLRCGREQIKLTESFMCDDCSLKYGDLDTDFYTTCDCCGRRIFVDDAWHVDDEEVCKDCLDSECFFCEHCEDYHFTEDRVYDEKNDEFICRWCADFEF